MVDAWTKGADESYPSKAVRTRSKRLRWRLRLKRGVLLVLMLLVGVTSGLGGRRMDHSGSPVRILLGFGSMFAVTSLFTDPWAEDQVRALQLYDLLKQVALHSEGAEHSTH